VSSGPARARRPVVLSSLGRLPTLQCAAALEGSVRVITDVRASALAADRVPVAAVDSVRFPVVALTAATRYTSPPASEWLATIRAEVFDALVARRLPPCDVLDCWSSSSLRTISRARESGAFVLLNRGSTHILHQAHVLAEEYARWGIRGTLPTSRIIERELAEYERADLIVVPSAQAAETFRDNGAVRRPVSVNVFGVDSTTVVLAERGPELTTGGFRLLFVGFDAIRKGLPDALEGWRRAGRPGTFEIVSDAPRWLRRRYDGPGITFLGLVRDIEQTYRRASALVLPSLEEGHARVMLQALASGLPVIATREAGACDLPVSPAIRVVPIRNPDAIAAAIECIRSNSQPEELRQEARSIAARFPWERYVSEHLSFYPAAVRASLGIGALT
jgi:glycosyltransferase involved in cell wall biosynthesis